MKTMFGISKVALLFMGVILLGSWNNKPTKEYLKFNSSFTSCGNDVYMQNNISKNVDFVKFTSTLETKTFNNIAANGGGASGIHSWTLNVGFNISVKLPANPGTGRIRVFKDSNLVSCIAFSNNSTSTTYSIDDFTDFSICPGAFYVYIETSAC